jgi:hypothetical protein
MFFEPFTEPNRGTTTTPRIWQNKRRIQQMGQAKIRHNAEQFVNHMEEKAKFWEAKQVCILKDCAIFAFPFMYQCDRAVSALATWGDTYGYDWTSDAKNQLMIHNKEQEEDGQ